MLRPEQNEVLVRVGRGTPMGEVLRRFWLPALLSEDLPEPDCAPVRMRLLGEDLVGFRDSFGRVGILDAYCAHRRAHLFWGRNEEGGLRCVYHGWKYDVEGRCLEIPNEPPGVDFRGKVRQRAYRAKEAGGIIWVYMGEKEREPAFPEFEWFELPPEHYHVSCWIEENNWVQTLEGDLDSSHISFLHRSFVPIPNMPAVTRGAIARRAPTLRVKDTEYGLVYGARRPAEDGKYYWRVTQWVIPGFTFIPSSRGSTRGCFLIVPIDDCHTLVFHCAFRRDRPFTQEERRPTVVAQKIAFKLLDGYIIDVRRPIRNQDNDFMIDREKQKRENYTGIEGIQDQDICIRTSMGRIVDRSREHLGTSDLAIIAMRRRLLRMAKEVQEGREPLGLREGWWWKVRPLDVISEHSEFEELLRAYQKELGMALP